MATDPKTKINPEKKQQRDAIVDLSGSINHTSNNTQGSWKNFTDFLHEVFVSTNSFFQGIFNAGTQAASDASLVARTSRTIANAKEVAEAESGEGPPVYYATPVPWNNQQTQEASLTDSNKLNGVSQEFKNQFASAAPDGADTNPSNQDLTNTPPTYG